MSLPMFIEVSCYPSYEEDKKIVFDLEHPKKATIPLSWIGIVTEDYLVDDTGKRLAITSMTLQYGQKLAIKEHYETVIEKINQCLPGHLKREPWESDGDNLSY